jgi:cysteine synthase A
MKIYNNVLEMIGDTPVIRLESYSKPGVEVFLKLEFHNPGGSIKDRPAAKIIEEAQKRLEIKAGGTIVEATSGNTGIGLSLVGAVKGYRVVIVMPENMSIERQKIMKAYGAELVLTPKEDGMKGAIEVAESMKKNNPEYFTANQFGNKDNAKAHEEGTAIEILKQMDNELDYFVNGIGTGGTITGVGKVLKENLKNIKIIGVEPSGSAVISGSKAGPHKLQGIGAGFIPDILNVSLLDELILVENEEAYTEARLLARKEGLMVGISTGANLAAVRKLVSRIESDKGIKILTMSASSGERYLSTDLYE